MLAPVVDALPGRAPYPLIAAFAPPIVAATAPSPWPSADP